LHLSDRTSLRALMSDNSMDLGDISSSDPDGSLSSDCEEVSPRTKEEIPGSLLLTLKIPSKTKKKDGKKSKEPEGILLHPHMIQLVWSVS
jgi:hypothetical protein